MNQMFAKTLILALCLTYAFAQSKNTSKIYVLKSILKTLLAPNVSTILLVLFVVQFQIHVFHVHLDML